MCGWSWSFSAVNKEKKNENPRQEKLPGVLFICIGFLEDGAELIHQILVAGHGDVVQAQHVVSAHLLSQLGHRAVLVVR